MHHTGMYVVELGVGIGKGGESCRRKKGKRIVEEMRGRICEVIHVGDKCVGRT